MKLSRAILGKHVEITWRDPRFAQISCRRDELPKGMAALATQVERGLVDDVTEGVVRIIHSEASHPLDPGESHTRAEWQATWVHEALITAIVIYEPVPGRPDGAEP